jgi:hypothetical protein
MGCMMGSVPGRGRERVFSLRHCIHTGSDANPASFSVGISTRALSLGVKRLGHEADHSIPSSTEVKTTFPKCLHGMMLN